MALFGENSTTTSLARLLIILTLPKRILGTDQPSRLYRRLSVVCSIPSLHSISSSHQHTFSSPLFFFFVQTSSVQQAEPRLTFFQQPNNTNRKLSKCASPSSSALSSPPWPSPPLPPLRQRVLSLSTSAVYVFLTLAPIEKYHVYASEDTNKRLPAFNLGRGIHLLQH